MKSFPYKQEILSLVKLGRVPKKIDFGPGLEYKELYDDGTMRDHIYLDYKDDNVYYTFYYRDGRFHYSDHICGTSVVFDYHIPLKGKPFREITATGILEDSDIEIIKKLLKCIK